MIDDKVQKLLFDPNGPFGLTEAFFQNAVAEVAGFVLGALVFSLLLPIVIDARQSRKWRPARQNFGQELMLLHVAFGDALARFVNSPDGPSRARAADAIEHAFRAIPSMTGLFAYALTATISREVNDYMRMLRAVRDWSHEASHPEDLAFASAERRIPRTRDMFEGSNREFKDVLDVLGVRGYSDVCWPASLIRDLEAAFESTPGAG
jgi:hypothetical protein